MRILLPLSDEKICVKNFQIYSKLSRDLAESFPLAENADAFFIIADVRATSRLSSMLMHGTIRGFSISNTLLEIDFFDHLNRRRLYSSVGANLEIPSWNPTWKFFVVLSEIMHFYKIILIDKKS